MDTRIRRVISLTTVDLHSNTSLAEISESVKLSPSRLRHLFKDETGVPLSAYLRSLRMLMAKQLLETTFMSVKEVMFSVGVNDPSHFVRDFSKRYGRTPAKYRAHFLHTSTSERLKVAASANK